MDDRSAKTKRLLRKKRSPPSRAGGARAPAEAEADRHRVSTTSENALELTNLVGKTLETLVTTPGATSAKARRAEAKKKALSATEMIEHSQAEDEDRLRVLRVDEGQVEFPRRRPRRNPCDLPVLDPRMTVKWDVFMMLLILYIMTVTPFELAFLRPPTPSEISEMRGSSYSLFCVNKAVDACFVVDIFVSLHTAFFDRDAGAWVMAKSRIAARYAESWLVIDILSVVPYELLPLPEQAGILKMVRLIRLLKLLRVARQPRIMAKLAMYNTMHASQQIVVKFFITLVLLIHLSACAFRIVDAMVLDGCHVGHHAFGEYAPGVGGGGGARDRQCPESMLLPFERAGIWRQYVFCLKWSLQTLLGDLSFTVNVAEEVCALIVALLGCIVLAFLVGDMCNALTNMDPVGNDYRLTLDTLNSYLEQSQMPHELRFKLREYMGSTEGIFRENYNKSLLARLSPGLTAIVAHHNLGGVVRRVSFYNYTLLRVYDLREGRRVAVFPRRTREAEDRDAADAATAIHEAARLKRPSLAAAQRRHELEANASRLAVVVGLRPNPVRLTVRYDDDGTVESGISADRVDARTYGDAALQARVASYMYERDQFVVALARIFETQLFMARDVLISRDMSCNDVMFSLTVGKIAVWGQRTVNPLRDFKIFRVHDTIGDDVCMLLVGDKRKRARHYSARAITAVQVYALDGLRFAEAAAGFDEFHHSLRLFGCWQMVKTALLYAARNAKTLNEKVRLGPAAGAAAPSDAAALREVRALTERLTQRLFACSYRVLLQGAPPPKAWAPLLAPLRELDRAFRRIDRGDAWSGFALPTLAPRAAAADIDDGGAASTTARRRAPAARSRGLWCISDDGGYGSGEDPWSACADYEAI